MRKQYGLTQVEGYDSQKAVSSINHEFALKIIDMATTGERQQSRVIDEIHGRYSMYDIKRRINHER